VRASERYLMLEFRFNLNQGCSGVETAFLHLFSSTTRLAVRDVALKEVT